MLGGSFAVGALLQLGHLAAVRCGLLAVQSQLGRRSYPQITKRSGPSQRNELFRLLFSCGRQADVSKNADSCVRLDGAFLGSHLREVGLSLRNNFSQGRRKGVFCETNRHGKGPKDRLRNELPRSIPIPLRAFRTPPFRRGRSALPPSRISWFGEAASVLIVNGRRVKARGGSRLSY
jgi:hypothetical protein